ncbi:hypothetical protein ACEWY4_014028 [Coilia grayii]|uniref:SCAN box domain-containing protein n=1 Tax=Coilia grayii TaxID=363190 RepID=A0ABD1JR44_9TELE
MNQLREDLEEGQRTASDGGQRQAEQGDNQRSDDEEPQHPAGGPPALEDQPAAPHRARAAYVAMDIEEAMDYDRVKEAILMKYEINKEIYRERFREPDIRLGETPKERYHRLKDLYKKWIKGQLRSGKTVEKVGEKIILEQYLRSLAPAVHIWVKEHNPATGQQAAEWVEAFLSARRGPKTFRFQRVSRPAAGEHRLHILGHPHHSQTHLLEAPLYVISAARLDILPETALLE